MQHFRDIYDEWLVHVYRVGKSKHSLVLNIAFNKNKTHDNAVFVSENNKGNTPFKSED